MNHPEGAVSILDTGVIARAVDGFPDSWPTVALHRIGRLENGDYDWLELSRLELVGGVYTFLLPRSLLAEQHTRDLGKGVQLDFPADSLPHVHGSPKRFLAYVGRSKNLLGRIKRHILAHSPSSSQLLDRLAECLKPISRDDLKAANKDRRKQLLGPYRDVLMEKGSLAYYILDGKENTANRHCVEDSLCGKYGPPFSIEVEH